MPGRPGHVGRDSEFGNRLFVEAVIWKFRTGVPWRDMPARFGAWKNIHTRFSRWAVKGIWESLFKAVADDPDTEYAMIDATIVRAHQHSAGARKKPIVNQAIGRSRGGLTTKIHMVVDAFGKSARVQSDRRPGPRHHSSRNATLRASRSARSSRLSRPKRIAKSNAIAISPSTPSAIWLNDSSNSAVFQFARTGRRAIHDGSLGSLPEKAPHKLEICRFADPFSRENSFTYYDRATLLDLN